MNAFQVTSKDKNLIFLQVFYEVRSNATRYSLLIF